MSDQPIPVPNFASRAPLASRTRRAIPAALIASAMTVALSSPANASADRQLLVHAGPKTAEIVLLRRLLALQYPALLGLDAPAGSALTLRSLPLASFAEVRSDSPPPLQPDL